MSIKIMNTWFKDIGDSPIRKERLKGAHEGGYEPGS